MLIDENLAVNERMSYAAVIQSETARLSSLTQQLLLLTSLDQLSTPLTLNTFSLDKQLKKETIRKYRWLLEEKNMTLSMDIDEVDFKGDPSFLEKVWENLFSNALKYMEEGTVEICLVDNENDVVIEVRDTGIGIKDHDIERIFDRFYRADHSRTISGTGLGLLDHFSKL